MLAILAFTMIATFMTLIMTKRLSALVALILVPTLFALGMGFTAGLGEMMIAGVRELAPTGVMLIFGILYFGLMIDAGLFDPLIKLIVRLVHGDALRITIGTVVLALLVSLDGDGTTTYMITTAALLPLYRHMKMDVRIMACLIILSGAVMNLLPWGGPTARAATALNLDPRDVFVGLIPAMAVTAGWVLVVAWIFGLRERKRLAALHQAAGTDTSGEAVVAQDAGDVNARRPRLMWLNLLLTAVLMTCLLLGMLPLAILFMLGFAVALMINYPSLQQQRERINAHAGNALAVAGLVFAAGIFTGILSGTEMIDAMADTIIACIPPALGPYMAPITALLSMPFTFLISNDAFYFGMLPILARTGAEYGISAMDMAQASLVGQQIHLLSPLVPSTYLLATMAGVEFGEHQRFTMKWALGSCAIFLPACLLLGIFPLAV
ncbi:CitMHS family transporter [Peristeroidobacter soli]|uniref:CitMHS family transporter n=1 Tax=Peristeroidobacter soli TaxID=2497877 RepID=UPI00101D1487|nr:citrate:proton symporter [Peristeroidobacter soli]